MPSPYTKLLAEGILPIPPLPGAHRAQGGTRSGRNGASDVGHWSPDWISLVADHHRTSYNIYNFSYIAPMSCYCPPGFGSTVTEKTWFGSNMLQSFFQLQWLDISWFGISGLGGNCFFPCFSAVSGLFPWLVTARDNRNSSWQPRLACRHGTGREAHFSAWLLQRWDPVQRVQPIWDCRGFRWFWNGQLFAKKVSASPGTRLMTFCCESGNIVKWCKMCPKISNQAS